MLWLPDHPLYQNILQRASEAELPWEALADKHMLIAGATGLMGRFLVDLLMYQNERAGLNCRVIALSRNEGRAREVFLERYFSSSGFTYKSADVKELGKKMRREFLEEASFHYIVNLASTTHPTDYARKPIETILSNVLGTEKLLELCAECVRCRFLLSSSVEIYGENTGNVELFNERSLGYLDSNTLRAGYPESKRVCEALCQAYLNERGADSVVVRFPRLFGPTMQEEDSKAVSQFIRKAARGQDIVLKSDGRQCYSFLFVPDAVLGMLRILLSGKTGAAYNLADEEHDRTLREMAGFCAAEAGRQVVFQPPEDEEQKGYSTATKARLDGSRAKKLGWKPVFGIEEGLSHTIRLLRDCRGSGYTDCER